MTEENTQLLIDKITKIRNESRGKGKETPKIIKDFLIAEKANILSLIQSGADLDAPISNKENAMKIFPTLVLLAAETGDKQLTASFLDAKPEYKFSDATILLKVLCVKQKETAELLIDHGMGNKDDALLEHVIDLAKRPYDGFFTNNNYSTDDLVKLLFHKDLADANKKIGALFPLEVAAKSCDYDSMGTLLNHGAGVKPIFRNIMDSFQKCPSSDEKNDMIGKLQKVIEEGEL